ncbi:unnamed protein product [Alopecurus aequalis]
MTVTNGVAPLVPFRSSLRLHRPLAAIHISEGLKPYSYIRFTAMALYRLPLLVLIAMVPLLAAYASHNQLPPEPTSAPLRYHPSPASTATVHFHPVPSATTSSHQNHLGMDQSQSTLALDRSTVEGQPSSREEAMAGNHPAQFGPAQATTTPPPLTASPDLTSQAPTRKQEAAATATTTLPPLPDQRTAAASASSRPPFQAGVAKAVPLRSDEGLLPLARVLVALGYKEMASAATLYPNLQPLARWHGPITIFAAPDISLQRCSTCSRRRVLLEHIALGYYPYSELAASPTIKIPSASLNLCLNIATVRGTFSIHYARLFVEGVEISQPEVYNDGRYIIHGLRTFLEPLSQYSCFDRSHSRHCHDHDDNVPTRSGDNMPARSDATSVSMSSMRVSIRIREVIARLRGGA